MIYRPGENVHWTQAEKAVDGVVGPNSVASGVDRHRHVEIAGTADGCRCHVPTEPVPVPKASSS